MLVIIFYFIQFLIVIMKTANVVWKIIHNQIWKNQYIPVLFSMDLLQELSNNAYRVSQKLLSPESNEKMRAHIFWFDSRK